MSREEQLSVQGVGRKQADGGQGISPNSPTGIRFRGWIWVPTPNWGLELRLSYSAFFD